MTRGQHDRRTVDLLPDHDLAGERPAPLTKKEREAARQKRFKDRHGVKALTVHLPVALLASFNEAVKKRAADNGGLTKSDVIANLIKTQYLRKR